MLRDTHLSPERTPLVGREGNLADLAAAFDGGARLVTLLGPPGVGKSRLAAHHAATVADGFDGGALRCALGRARAMADALPILAEALQIPLSQDPHADIARVLEARGSVLLLLDDADGVARDLAEALDRWMAAAPEARWLVTSRERLRVAGERVLEVHPLGLPASPSEAHVRSSEAGRLFAERAAAVRPGYAVTPENAPAVHDLLHELDGLPFAIELAAARMRVLPAAKLLERVRGGRDVASPSASTASRHATLRSAIRDSWELLDAPTRSALATLSAFSGGFDLDAATAVLAGGEDHTLDCVAALVDRSLLTVEPDPDGALRYRMYESVRAFAAEHLEPAERDAVATRHAAHYLAAARRWADGLLGKEGPACLRRLARERENLDAVVAWAEAIDPPTRESVGAVIEALAVTEGLLSVTGVPPRLDSMLDRALDRAGPLGVDPRVRARGHLLRARAASLGGEVEMAERHYRAGRALALDVGAPDLDARSLLLLGNLAFRRGLHAEAERRLQEAQTAAREAGDRRTEGEILSSRCVVCRRTGRHDEARAAGERAIVLLRNAGDGWTEGLARANLAILDHEQGRLPDARQGYERALELLHTYGDRFAEALNLGNLGMLQHEQGNLGEARCRFEAAAAAHRDVGNTRGEATAVATLATLLHEAGDLEGARSRYRTALEGFRLAGDPWSESVVLGGLGALQAATDQLEAAAEAFERAEAQLGSTGDAGHRAALEVHRGHLDLAWARAAEHAGEAGLAASHREAARTRLERGEAGEPGEHARYALRLLQTALEGASPALPEAVDGPAQVPSEALAVQVEGEWFRPPGGPVVDISKRHLLRRLLTRLAERRLEAPGTALPADDLLEAGWPGERMHPLAGTNRLYVALSELRKLGLREVLTRSEGGYRLDPSIPVWRVRAGSKDI